MATGRFVTAPNTTLAIPARAAVAAMRSLRTSEAIINMDVLSRRSRGDISPSLHATYSGIESHCSRSSRWHSHEPPVWDRREACHDQIYKSRADDEKQNAYVDSNDVCHSGERGQASSELPGESGPLDLVGLLVISMSTVINRNRKRKM